MCTPYCAAWLGALITDFLDESRYLWNDPDVLKEPSYHLETSRLVKLLSFPFFIYFCVCVRSVSFFVCKSPSLAFYVHYLLFFVFCFRSCLAFSYRFFFLNTSFLGQTCQRAKAMWSRNTIHVVFSISTAPGRQNIKGVTWLHELAQIDRWHVRTCWI